MRWPPDTVTSLRSMVADRMSASAIAECLGVTRNAVIGKAHRLGLALLGARPATADKSRKFKAKEPPRKASVVKQSARVSGVLAPVRPAMLGPKTAIEIETLAWSGHPQVAGVPMLHLRAMQCRYEVSDSPRGEEHLFCGAPASGAWCEAHRKIVYQGRTASTLPSVKEAA